TCLGEDAWPARVDPAELANAMLNLAINARDAMPSGGRLTLATRNVEAAEAAALAPSLAGGCVELKVTDDGKGMTEEVLQRAFEPFFTTKPPGLSSGLGLSQVYGFVRQSDGIVRIASALGRGTSVSLYLPRWSAAVRTGTSAATVYLMLPPVAQASSSAPPPPCSSSR